MTDATRNFNSEAVIEMNKNYYWFHSDWDKKEGIEKLYYEKIDVTTGKVIKSEQKVLEASKIVGTTMASGFYQFKTVNKYKYETDVTQKVLLVSYRLSPEEKNDKKSYDKIGFFVFGK